MPHDMNGNELKVGATVLVPCQVKAIHLTEEYCNVDLETNIVMHPSSNRTSLTLNSRQTIRKGPKYELELLSSARVIVDYVCNNGNPLEIPSTLSDFAHVLRPKLDEAIDG